MPSVKVWTAKKATRLAAWRRVVRGHKERGSSSLKSKEGAVRGKRVGRRKVRKGNESRYMEVQGERDKMAGWCDPDVALAFPESGKLNELQQPIRNCYSQDL